MRPAQRISTTRDNDHPFDAASDLRRDGRDFSQHSKSRIRRTATLFDAVAARVGLNGFLTVDQLRKKNVKPSAPEENLLRRVNAPNEIPYDYYNADEKLHRNQKLPDPDLLKALHAYVCDFYELANNFQDTFDYTSLDETGLLAMGILLEEACKEALGESGDMVFTEPQSRDLQVPGSGSFEAQHQIQGKLVLKHVQEHDSSSEDQDAPLLEKPRKRARRRYRSEDD